MSHIEPRKIRVYVACPYSGDDLSGVKRSIEAGAKLLLAGFAPMVPNMNHFFEPALIRRSRQYKTWRDTKDMEGIYNFWLSHDYAYLDVCHVILRLPSPPVSPGAVQEDIRARRMDKPVFYDVDELIAAKDALEKQFYG